MVFDQAAIRVQKEKEFEELKAAIERAFAPENVQTFLKRVASAGLRIRDFDGLLAKRILEGLGGPGMGSASAADLYAALAVTDQAQMKEFYLFKIEEVGPELRAKFHKLYQYY
jgi:hypothetical protein